MARTLLRKINQYSDEFKATAVGLSSLPGVLMQDVASFWISTRRRSMARPWRSGAAGRSWRLCWGR